MALANKLAFGIEKSKRKFHLRLARYIGMTDAVEAFRKERSSRGEDDKPLALLDVGAGHGRTLQYLRARGLDQGISFFGIDNAQERHDRLFEPERWEFRLLDVEKGLPYPDASFDIVICEQVLEHLEHPDAVLREISRVIKPGAMAILGVPSFPPGLAWIRRRIVPRVDRLLGKQRDHAQVFTKGSFTDLISQSGALEVQKVQAFRWVSGGILAPLENLEWWYRFSRRVATAAPSLAVEVQVIAHRPVAPGPSIALPHKPAVVRLLQSWGTDARRPGLQVTIAFLFVMIMCGLAGAVLSDRTSHHWFGDESGLLDRFSVAAWLGLGAMSLFALPGALLRVLAAAGCLAVAGIEAEWWRLHEIAPWADGWVIPAGLLGFAAIASAVLMQRRRLKRPWIGVLLAGLLGIALSQIAKLSPEVLYSWFAIRLSNATSKIMQSLEEGAEFTTPILLCIAILVGWSQKWSIPTMRPPAAAA